MAESVKEQEQQEEDVKAEELELAADRKEAEEKLDEAAAAAKSATDLSSIDTMDDLPAWAQKQIREANNEARNLRQRMLKLEQETNAAEEARLAEQNNYKELYERANSRAEQLKEKADIAEGLTEWALAFVQQTTADWPEEVLSMKPDDQDPVELMKWMKKSQPLVNKLQMKAKATIPATPNRAEVGVPKELEEEANNYALRFYRSF